MHTTQVPTHVRDLRAMLQHREIFRIALCAEIADGGAEAAHLAPAAHLQHPRQTFFQPIEQDPAIGWHRAQQMVELPLNCLEVIENVRVIEFQVIQDGGARPVMYKLAAFVKKRGVVLVCLNHKWGAPP